MDGISTDMIKLCSKELARPITHLINASLKEGQMPKMSKVTKDVPIYKKGDNEEVTNFKPISICHALSKTNY